MIIKHVNNSTNHYTTINNYENNNNHNTGHYNESNQRDNNS